MVDVGEVRQEDWHGVTVHCVELRVGAVVAVKKIGRVLGIKAIRVIDAEGGEIERLEQAREESVHAAFGRGKAEQLVARNSASHQDLVGV